MAAETVQAPPTHPSLARGPGLGAEFGRDGALQSGVGQASPFFQLHWMTGPGWEGGGGARTVSAAKADRVCSIITIAGTLLLKVSKLPADLSLLLL